jgi:flagellar biosynthetic protein FliP
MTLGHDERHLAAASWRPTICAMTTQISSVPDRHTAAQSRGHRVWHFVRHYLEMVVAMLAGMLVLGPLEGLVWPALTARPDVGVMVMATNMAIGMGAWMRFRGHSWRGIAEMSASMYVPFAVLLVPFWAGAIGEHTMMTWGHLLMLLAMALVMLLRPSEYAH